SARLDPRSQVEELAGRVVAAGGDPTLGHDLEDYSFLLEKTPDAADPLSDWIASLTAQRARSCWPRSAPGCQTLSSESRTHIWDRWRDTHALPWLVAAFVHSEPDDPEVGQLLAAAAAIP